MSLNCAFTALAYDDGGNGGTGSKNLYINTSNLDAIIELLEEVSDSVDAIELKAKSFKTDFDTTYSRAYLSTYYKNHMAKVVRGEGEEYKDYLGRIDSEANSAKNYVKEQKKAINEEIQTLIDSSTLSDLKKKVSIALSVFTNIKNYETEFDEQAVKDDYNNYFKQSVADASASGIFVKSYDGTPNSGGTSDNGEIHYKGKDGTTYTGREGRRAAATLGIMTSGEVAAAAVLGRAQGWTMDQIGAVQDAGYQYSSSLVQHAFESGSFSRGDSREEALAYYREVTGKDYNPEEINADTLRRLEEAGINPDTLGFFLGGQAGMTVTGAAGVALPVVAAALPSVIQGSKASMSPTQVDDFSRRLAISPVTGQTNEELLDRIANIPGGSGTNQHITYSDSTADVISKAISSPTTVYTDTRLTQRITDSISGFLPGGNDISSYSTTDQTRLIGQQALDQYFSRSSSEFETERARLLQQTEDAYNGIGVDEFKDQLKKGGYSDSDINYIMEHKEVGFTALVTATQASTLTDISNALATQSGISGLEFGQNLNSTSLYNGQAQAILGAEQDPDVTEARTAVARARAHYQQKVDNANSLIQKANDSKAELEAAKERIIKRSGEDTSKWSDEDIKEYNEYVEKYNQANKDANDAVNEANGAKDDFEKSEADYKEIYDAKYEEYLKEAQEGIKAAQEAQQTGEGIPQEVGEPGAEIPGEGYDGGDSSILATVSGEDGGLSLGDGEQALGATVTTPQVESQPTYDGGDQAILSGLNIGDSGIGVGTPDGATVAVEPPVVAQPAPQQSVTPQQPKVDVQGANNVQVNETAFADERTLPGLGLEIDMNTITGGGNKGIQVEGVSGVFEAPAVDSSDAAILGGLNITENGISNDGNANNAPVPQVETPAINAMVSPELDKALSGELTTDHVDTAVRESSNSHKIDTSKFVEPPSSESEVKGIAKELSTTKTDLDHGIVIELGEDGSLRL